MRLILLAFIASLATACGVVPGLSGAGARPAAPRTELLIDNLKIPMSLAFAPDGRLFFNEVYEGRVRLFRGGQLQEAPWAELEVARGPETGLLGLAVDPQFSTNRYIYLYYSEPDPNRRNNVPLRNRVIRMTDRDGRGEDLTVILDDLPISRTGRHSGGRITFGPDGMLYVGVGNAESSRLGQELGSLGGKILRVRPDGTIPVDNPFPESPVYALGFRNPFGLAFHPMTGQLYANENSGKGHDEVNQITPGGNYGNPVVEGRGDDPRFVNPIWESGEPSAGPTGLAFYSGSMFPELANDLLFCGVHVGTLQRFRLAGERLDEVVSIEDIAEDCRLDVVVGPDAAIYYASINRIFRYVR
ncbi:MAG: PQQ-dependent sugar dehydrogenase [Chloroflexota bacterium]